MAALLLAAIGAVGSDNPELATAGLFAAIPERPTPSIGLAVLA